MGSLFYSSKHLFIRKIAFETHSFHITFLSTMVTFRTFWHLVLFWSRLFKNYMQKNVNIHLLVITVNIHINYSLEYRSYKTARCIFSIIFQILITCVAHNFYICNFAQLLKMIFLTSTQNFTSVALKMWAKFFFKVIEKKIIIL